MKKILLILALILIAGCSNNYEGDRVACIADAKLCPDGSYVGRSGPNCEFDKCPDMKITNFKECEAAGNPIMESYPRRCAANGETFIEDIIPFEKRCELDEHCACGTHVETKECFIGNVDFVNIKEQCPNFCTGIAGHLEVRCIENKCGQISTI